jgi:hypothetical protein
MIGNNQNTSIGAAPTCRDNASGGEGSGFHPVSLP